MAVKNNRHNSQDSKRYFDWLDHSSADLVAASLLKEDDRCYDQAAFHCQQAIEKALTKARHHVIAVLPYSMGGMVETLHNNAQVKNVEYTSDGIEVETIVDDILYGRLRDYIAMEL